MTHRIPSASLVSLPHSLNAFNDIPHILIIDDNPLDTELAQLVLMALEPDARITVLHSPLDALDYLAFEGAYAQRERVQPDLVLLDINMPCIHGFEVLATLRADPQTRHLNIVLCSTSDDADDMRVGRELGANGYLVKPPCLDSFEAILKPVLQAWTSQAG
ncbi:response regulator [Deinococcus peraridilitoris]|uniref:Response regulator containing a CheY-like receiver domain and a GGDEF domain protein n=1 Tax=Deinococcus peraridilitoris (strain DSM 19664 / LMG 22246 / CIP 109416 / KR-200) TaxID=937777 RepID=L0A401_DEIPD|nr:response regulator [Deinococcus peraridilitoris]AFZ67750.1 response regulator containing a CheY-like receiver domain and a GGDEF domain protein [Deinococcus peraridilitoris DSM 19664]